MQPKIPPHREADLNRMIVSLNVEESQSLDSVMVDAMGFEILNMSRSATRFSPDGEVVSMEQSIQFGSSSLSAELMEANRALATQLECRHVAQQNRT